MVGASVGGLVAHVSVAGSNEQQLVHCDEGKRENYSKLYSVSFQLK